MTFEEAFTRSARAYFAGKTFDETEKITPDRKYKKDYFDKIEKEATGDTEKPVKKAKDLRKETDA